MQYAQRYLQSAEATIRLYNGGAPFHHFIKQYFAANKKYGSKDRKAISHACYCYFRLGLTLNDLEIIDKIKAGIFLCQNEPALWSSIYNEKWLSKWSTDLIERIDFIKSIYQFEELKIFPWLNELSDGIDKAAFSISHLIQPNLYLRIRPGKETKIAQQLTNAGINFTIDDSCVTLSNATKIDSIIELNRNVVVQDVSSQRIKSFFPNEKKNFKVWDCCAASGGKSILAFDSLKEIDLTVSDVRPSIIHNLEKRFADAGITKHTKFVADLSRNDPVSLGSKYDLIICDAPCTGSGTWGRTPEQLSFFDSNKIVAYANLQKQIASNALKSLKAEGYFLYITCSVFEKENEAVVSFLKEEFHLQIIKMELLKGYDQKADTMFAALLQKIDSNYS